jgi:YfiH family protein
VAFTPTLDARRAGEVTLLEDARARELGVLVAFSNRRGGVSRAPFDSLNLAGRVGDDLDDVAANRERVAAAAGFEAGSLALSRQVHGARVVEVGPSGSGIVGEADGLAARAPGPVVGALTADCAPVVVAGRRGVAVLHAGWRGLAAGVIASGVDAVGPAWAAWVGPSIHACCYEVGPDVIGAFADAGLPVAGPDRVDPGRAAAVALRRAGVAAIASHDDCTSCSRHYFSYRRDGLTGRQGAFAAVLAS